MLLNESYWFNDMVNKYVNANDTVLNIGSSTKHFREIIQPHINNNLIQPLINKGARVIHIDIKDNNGVDIVGDINE